MKLTQQQCIEALKAAGVQHVEIVEDEAASEYNVDTVLQAVDTARSAIIKPKLQEELTGDLTKSIAGKFGGSLERILIRETGVDKAKFTEGMKDEEKIKIALEHRDGKYNQDTAGLREEMDKLIETHNQTVESLKSENEKAVKSANDRYVDRDIQDYIANSVLKEAPLPDGSDRSVLSQDFKRHLQDKYNLSYDEAGKAVSLFKKDNPAAPALNAAGTGHINLLDEAKEYFTPRGQWRTDMRDQKPADALQGKGTQYQPQGGNQQPGASSDPLAKLNASVNALTATAQPA